MKQSVCFKVSKALYRELHSILQAKAPPTAIPEVSSKVRRPVRLNINVVARTLTSKNILNI